MRLNRVEKVLMKPIEYIKARVLTVDISQVKR